MTNHEFSQTITLSCGEGDSTSGGTLGRVAWPSSVPDGLTTPHVRHAKAVWGTRSRQTGDVKEKRFSVRVPCRYFEISEN